MGKKRTLKDVMPLALSEREGLYCKTKAHTMLDIEVMAEHGDPLDDDMVRWPGKHKNVFFWVELKNGYAVGWNENLSKGWSFPVLKLKEERI